MNSLYITTLSAILCKGKSSLQLKPPAPMINISTDSLVLSTPYVSKSILEMPIVNLTVQGIDISDTGHVVCVPEGLSSERIPAFVKVCVLVSSPTCNV